MNYKLFKKNIFLVVSKGSKLYVVVNLPLWIFTDSLVLIKYSIIKEILKNLALNDILKLVVAEHEECKQNMEEEQINNGDELA